MKRTDGFDARRLRPRPQRSWGSRIGLALGLLLALLGLFLAGFGAASVVPSVNGDAPISLKDIARQAAREAERVAIKEVLDRVHWNRAKAARLLQISYKALLYKIVQCGLVSQDAEPDKPKEIVAS